MRAFSASRDSTFAICLIAVVAAMQSVLLALLIGSQHSTGHLRDLGASARVGVQQIAYFAATAHLKRPEPGWAAGIESALSTITAARNEAGHVPYLAHVFDTGTERALTQSINAYFDAARALERDPRNEAAFGRIVRLRPVVLAGLDNLAYLQADSITRRNDALVGAVVVGLAAELVTLASIWFGVLVPLERRLRTSMMFESGQMQSFFERNPDAIAICDRNAVLVNANRAGCELLGGRAAELVGRHLSAFIEPSRHAQTAAAVERANSGEFVTVDSQLCAAAGDPVDIALSLFPRVVAGQACGFVATLHDLRSRKAAAAERAGTAERLAALAEIASPSGDWKQQLEAALELAARQLGYEHGDITQIEGTNATILATTGLPAQTEIGSSVPLDGTLYAYIVRTDDVWAVDDVLASQWRDDDAVRATAARSIVAIRLRLGKEMYGSLALASANPRSTPLRPADHDFLKVVAALAGSILSRRARTAQLGSPALTDALTGLPNRVAIVDQLDRLTRSAANRAGAEFAVHFIDLDGFRQINEIAGHDVGDEVLREVARRFSKCVRDTDIVARLGGDKFLVLQPVPDGPEGPHGVAQLAERIWRIVEQPFVHEGVRYTLRCSAGVSMFPGDGEDTRTLINRADEARHRAKAERRSVA